MTWGIEFVWPDYVHVDYGYPLSWGVHTLNTIHRTVDAWTVNLTALILDLAFWLDLMIIGLFLIFNVKKRK